jgi:hypothetical protein
LRISPTHKRKQRVSSGTHELFVFFIAFRRAVYFWEQQHRKLMHSKFLFCFFVRSSSAGCLTLTTIKLSD